MTNEERDLIDKFVARVGGAANGGFGGSVPQNQPALAAIDPEADRYIAMQFQTHPEARYRITQMAVVQEAALAEAANRIQRLQAELEATRQQAQQAQQGGGQHRGFLGSLFGGGAGQPAQPPAAGVWNQGQPPQPQQYAPPQYAQPASVPSPPGVQPGMFQRSGSGFLGSALSTAAGVAGGVVAGNVLMDMFSGHGGGMGGMGGGMFGGGGGFAGGMPMPTETTVINNYGDAGQGGADQGGWDNAQQGSGGVDPAWDNSTQGDGGGGWDDNSGGGGFDDSNT